MPTVRRQNKWDSRVEFLMGALARYSGMLRGSLPMDNSALLDSVSFDVLALAKDSRGTTSVQARERHVAGRRTGRLVESAPRRSSHADRPNGWFRRYRGGSDVLSQFCRGRVPMQGINTR